MRMIQRKQRQQEALEEVKNLLNEADDEIELILVEGSRDENALRFLGYHGIVEVCAHIDQTEQDIAIKLSENVSRVLVLTDFDKKGKMKANRLSDLLEAEGVQVYRDTRRKIGKLMAILGIRTIESFDNIAENLS
jgi:5S rRNA maturation endonuclease (ribonuclease M5)